jgi:proline dehydrogenase
LEEITRILYREKIFIGGEEQNNLDFDIKNHLNEDMKKQYDKLMHRLEKIIKNAADHKIKILLDAEQSTRQLGIHYVSLQLIKKFNVVEPIIYNTYQCYMKETQSILFNHLHTAKLNRFFLGVKIVRGAYVDHENEKARSLNLPSPIFENKTLTDNSYNSSLLRCLDHVHHGSAGVVVATHNEESVQIAVNKMHQINLKNDFPFVHFGTLLGMCDHIAFGLTSHGYQCFKLLPFGKIDIVFPYLFRRLQENSSVLSGTQRERDLMLREIKRRENSLK